MRSLSTFSFNAVKHADGFVTGQYQLHNRSADVQTHGSVTCLSVDGYSAWIGGVVERVAAGGSTRTAFRAEEPSGSIAPK